MLPRNQTLVGRVTLSKPASPIVGMKNWNAKKKRWDGVVCQVVTDEAGKESILVLDVMTSDDEDDLSAQLAKSIETKSWLIN